MKYVVVKKGVYQQGTWGPFDTPREAWDRARVLADADRDCYHKWAVHSIDPVDGLSDRLGFRYKKCGPESSCIKHGYCLGLALPEEAWLALEEASKRS